MRTNESEEMYLETILLLKDRLSCVRSVDIVEELGYAKSSVSRAVNLLAAKGYISVDGDGAISLTRSGEERAAAVYGRHCEITRLFVSIGASEEVAEADACRIEHVISDEMFEIIKAYNQRQK